jgi:hypothetical protein
MMRPFFLLPTRETLNRRFHKPFLKKTPYLLLCLLVVPLLGQTPPAETPPEAPPSKITILSDGLDVRTVLCSIFSQAKKSFIAEPGLSLALYLNLHEVPFETALDLICQNAGITYEIEDGVYHFFRKAQSPRRTSSSSPTLPVPQKTARPLDPSVLERVFTSKLSNVDLRTAIKEISQKTDVPIQVAPHVKNLKVNATFLETSLRYALNSLCQAGKLMYTFTPEGTILISDPAYAPATQAVATQRSQSVAKMPQCDQCQAELGKGWKYCPYCGNYVKPLTDGG